MPDQEPSQPPTPEEPFGEQPAGTAGSSEFDDMLDFMDSGPTVDEISDQRRVIYGVDDRKDLYDVVDDAAVMRDADSVVSLWKESDLVDNGDGTFTLQVQRFQDAYRLCPDEPFAQQFIGAYCSGVLVAPDIVATAGHCINTPKYPIGIVRFVFGFRMLGKEEPALTVDASEVYSGVEMLGWHLDADGTDWALVRLDRPVPNHPVATLRREGKIAEGAGLHVIGHPCGLPAKYAPEAEVRDNAPNPYFVANLDTYGGNSGAPVFDSASHVVEGLLVRGAPDFIPRGSCFVSNVCPEVDGTPNCKGEEVVRATEFSALVPREVGGSE